MRRSLKLSLLFSLFLLGQDVASAQPANNIGLIFSPSISMASEVGTPTFNKDYFKLGARPAMMLGVVYNYRPAENINLFTGLQYGWHSYNVIQHKFDDNRLSNSSVVVTPVITSLDGLMAVGYSIRRFCLRGGITYSFAQYENNFYIKNVFKDHVAATSMDEYYLVTDGSNTYGTFGAYGSISYNWKSGRGRSFELGLSGNYWFQASPLFHLQSQVYNKVYVTDFQARQYNVSLHLIRYFGLGKRSDVLN